VVDETRVHLGQLLATVTGVAHSNCEVVEIVLGCWRQVGGRTRNEEVRFTRLRRVH
jgi:hypothetical protein